MADLKKQAPPEGSADATSGADPATGIPSGSPLVADPGARAQSGSSGPHSLAAAPAGHRQPEATGGNPLAAKLKLRLDEDQLTNCMRCGFCLPACPTFRETGIEAESPRGRIALMKAVADGLMEPDAAFEEQMNHCLGCRACEPACPADVKYGRLIEQARDAIEDHTDSHRRWVKAVRRAVFRSIFPHQRRMRLVGSALRLYQRSGLRQLARGSGMLKLLPEHLAAMEQVLPEASSKGVAERIGVRHPAKGERIATVGLFRGCMMDVLFTETNIHTVDLLTEAGFEVVIPTGQNCCGALHAHSGEAAGARELAIGNIEAFREAGVDYIVSNAGGCGAIMTEYGHLLHEDGTWSEEASRFAQRVIDVGELLVRFGRELPFSTEAAFPEAAASGDAASTGTRINGHPPYEGTMRCERMHDGGNDEGCGTPKLRVTYQDSCHLRNVMRTPGAPRRLIRRVDGVEFVEMAEADRCCGSAGIYNLTQPEMAGQLLAHKMEHANATGAQVLLTSNPGCLLQMKLGVLKHGRADMQVMHVVDFLHRHRSSDS